MLRKITLNEKKNKMKNLLIMIKTAVIFNNCM